MTDRQDRRPRQLELEAPARRAPPTSYTVTQLVRLASRRLEAAFGGVWVEGEVSNLRTPASGHLYFTLKDRRAQLPVVIFRSSASRLKFRVEDGQSLRCRGTVAIYETQGRFQLTSDLAEPTGLGAQQLALEQLKRRLADEGLFDERHKKDLPRLPRTVVVVTSKTGAALRDIIRVFDHRCPVRVLVVPTMVQGRDAGSEIAAALRRADRAGGDVIIVGRGGGSLEDLWAFNQEQVARAIFAAQTPVISAVGHEIDVTLADLVADRRAPTPSAAAEIAVPVLDDLHEHVATLRGRLGRATQRQTGRQALELERLRRRLGTPAQVLNRARLSLDEQLQQLQQLLRARLRTERDGLASLQLRLGAQRPQARLARDRARLDNCRDQLSIAMARQVDGRRSCFSRLIAELHALSPLAVLGRGYSLVRDDAGNVVRDAATVNRGDPLEITLHRGVIDCTVQRARRQGDS